MTTESNMWKWLKQGVDHRFSLERVENSVGAGFPDVWGYRLNVGAFFIELKQCQRPAKDTSKLKIRLETSQPVWHERQLRLKNKKVWFLIYVGRERFLVPSCMYPDFKDMTYETIQMWNVSKLNQTQLLEKASEGYG